MKTDSQLQQDVSAELDWEPSVHAARIGVEVKDGVVTLSGKVGWQFQRQAATDSVRHLMGVTGVSNQIAIQVHGGDVTLTGTVRNWDERETATHAAWGTPGVRNVVDRMTLVY